MNVKHEIKIGTYKNHIPLHPYPVDGNRKAILKYIEAREAYRKKGQVLIRQLRTDLEKEFNMKGHPKAANLWNKAWDLGHGKGGGEGSLEEIYWYYDYLSDLLSVPSDIKSIKDRHLDYEIHYP